jgi:hypothetical protein
MATFDFVLIYPSALTEMWRLVPKLLAVGIPKDAVDL